MAPEEPTDMVREKMWVERPANTHLSQARTPGGYSSLARDNETNELETHATLFPIGDDDPDETDSPTDSPPIFDYISSEHDYDSHTGEPSALNVLLGVLVLLGAIKAAERLAPHAKRFWNERALPALESKWNTLAWARKIDDHAATDKSDALEDYRPSMSSTEARERFVAALIARLFSEQQLHILRNTRIEDEAGPSDSERALAMLTSMQIADGITLMLETNPSLVDEEMLAELVKILGSSQVGGGRVRPRSEELEEALHPMDGELKLWPLKPATTSTAGHPNRTRRPDSNAQLGHDVANGEQFAGGGDEGVEDNRVGALDGGWLEPGDKRER